MVEQNPTETARLKAAHASQQPLLTNCCLRVGNRTLPYVNKPIDPATMVYTGRLQRFNGLLH